MSINLDKPVSHQTEDWFQRYEFGKRIASIVSRNMNSHSLTVAIYGKWGQGKTTLLNFIRAELPEDIIVINFNPWFFSETPQLLKSFLDHFTEGLGKSPITTKEKVGNFFRDYGSAIGAITQFVGLGTEDLEGLGSRMSSVSIEHLKKKIDDFIIEANRNIVVFIDDIDRLDVEEAQQIFKLVKLVGDFPRTSYILSFDHELIAAALAPKYGSGTKEAGAEFLEKIIQLPLNLPKARKQDLRSFLIKLFENALEEIQVELTSKEKNEVKHRLDEAFIPALDNPRLAVRLANAINFSIPLLRGEINLVDLITIEAIRIFFPELYLFIKTNPHYFISSYSYVHNNFSRKEKSKDEAKNKITQAVEAYGVDMKDPLLSMLQDLFPTLQTVFANTYYTDQYYMEWYREMRICSSYYFERYFSYAIQKGKISDIVFKNILIDIGEISVDELIKRLSLHFQTIEVDEFIFKLYQYQHSFTPVESKVLAAALANFGEVFEKAKKDFFYGTIGMAASIIFSLLQKVPTNNRLKAALQVLDFAEPLTFLIDIQFKFWTKPKYDDIPPFLKEEELEIIAERILERFQEIATKDNLFNILPDDDFYRVVKLFIRVNRTNEVSEMLQQQIEIDSKNVLPLIKLFTPTASSSSKPSPYKVNFNEKRYHSLNTLIGCDLLYESSLKAYGKQTYTPIEDTEWSELTDTNLLALFQKIHEESKANKDEK